MALTRPVLVAAVLSFLCIPAAAAPSGATRLFLHVDVYENGAPPVMNLSVLDYPDRGNGVCDAFGGAPNEVMTATGAGAPQRWTFPAVDGLPLRLHHDAPVTGVVAMRALEVGARGNELWIGAGAASLDVSLSGRVASGRTVTIGTQSIDYTLTPLQEVYPLELRIAPAGAARGKTFTALTLTATARGASLLTGCIELDDPASFVEIPVAR